MYRYYDLSTQSDENVNTDIVLEKTTTFVDTNQTHDPDELNIESTAFNNAPLVDFPMIIDRPYIIGRFSWSAANTFKSQVLNLSLPGALLGNTLFYRKINYLAFWRPDIEISFRINGTPMHYGRLVACWIPQDQYLDPNYKHFENAFSNHWYQLSASSQQTVRFTVPFTFDKQYNAIQANENQFGLYVYVAVPLQSVNDTAAPIEVNVFARVINPCFAGYTVDTSPLFTQGDITLTTQGDAPVSEGLRASKVISNTLRKISDYVSSIVPIPAIGLYAAPISLIARAGSDLAALLGFSITPNFLPIQSMAIRQPRLATVEDKPNSVVIGTSYSTCLDKSNRGVCGDRDEITIQGFASRPALYYVGEITSSTAVDTQVFYTLVSPGLLNYFDYATPYDPTSFYSTPIQFVSRYANLWRGGIKFHFSFVASQFHSCRVRLSYVPYCTQTNPVINVTNEQDIMSVVMDITKETEYSIVIPYMQPTEWLSVFNEFHDVLPRHIYNGSLTMTILNTLTSGSTVVNPIYFQVFVSAANDFQLAMPTTRTLHNRGMFWTPTPPPELTTQGFEVLKCELPSSSMECLKTTPHMSITMRDSGRLSHRVNTSFEIHSLKQLVNMLTMAVGRTIANSFSAVVAVPGVLDITLGNTMSYNLLANMMTVFRYYKGGMRMSVLPMTGNLSVQAWRAYQDHFLNTDFLTTGIASDLSLNPQDVGAGALIQQSISVAPVDMVFPYYSRNNCYLTAVGSGTFGPTVMDQTLDIVNVLSNDITVVSYSTFLGGADDFMLGFQLGIPRSVALVPP